MKRQKLKIFLFASVLLLIFSFNISAQESLKKGFKDYFKIGRAFNLS